MNRAHFLDKVVSAECECGRERRELTFRQLKNKWPICTKCRRPMKIKAKDAVSSVHTTD